MRLAGRFLHLRDLVLPDDRTGGLRPQSTLRSPVGMFIEDPLGLLRFDLYSAEPCDPSRGHQRASPVASVQPLHSRAKLAVGDPKVEITPPVQLHLVVHRLLWYELSLLPAAKCGCPPGVPSSGDRLVQLRRRAPFGAIEWLDTHPDSGVLARVARRCERAVTRVLRRQARRHRSVESVPVGSPSLYCPR